MARSTDSRSTGPSSGRLASEARSPGRRRGGAAGAAPHCGAGGGGRQRCPRRTAARHRHPGGGETMRGRFVAAVVLVGAVGWPAAAAGQDRAGASNPREQEQCMPAPCVRGLAMGAAGALADPAPAFRAEGWRPLSIAKWGMLGLTAVAAVYGLSASL